MTTWAARFGTTLDPIAWDFMHSLPHDVFLWPYDILGTMAHVHVLQDAKILTNAEARRLCSVLRKLSEHPPKTRPQDEDVHSALERILVAELGDLGRKIHTARSRNDQVATASSLWLRAQLLQLLSAVAELTVTLSKRAAELSEAVTPGYTHLQRAQPITAGFWLLSHASALSRDLVRLDQAHDAARAFCPLAAGALASTTLPIDPNISAKLLGFDSSFINSLDAVSARDHFASALFAATMVAVNLSKLGEDIVLYSSAEFGFLNLSEKWSTGSSMMPQKKNPDVAELCRGAAAVSIGALTSIATLSKGLASGYNRDLQFDKQVTMQSLPLVFNAVSAMNGLISTMTVNEAAMQKAADGHGALATDLAERLVAEGVPFRTAYNEAAAAIKNNDASAFAGLTADRSVKARKHGPSPANTRKQASKIVKIAVKHATAAQKLREVFPSPTGISNAKLI